MDRIAPFGLLIPVFALISSVLFLGDRVTPKLVVGGLLGMVAGYWGGIVDAVVMRVLPAAVWRRMPR